MRILVKTFAFLFLFVTAALAGSDKTAYIYTVCPRELVLSVETNDVSSFMSLGKEVEVTGYFKMDEPSVLRIFDLLRNHLLVSVDTSKCSSSEYVTDDVVFNFYQYYLQVIPFYDGSARKVYVNAYMHDHNKDSSPERGFVWVLGGGAGYWSIIWNLEKNEFSNMIIHGSS